MITILDYAQTDPSQLLMRSLASSGVGPAVRAIVEDVAARGDAALLEYTARFDHAQQSEMEVPR